MYEDNEEEYASDYEDNRQYNEAFFKHSYVVIAIDTHPSMFIIKDDGSMPFRSCLEATYNVADSLFFKKDRRSWCPFSVILSGDSTPLITFDTSIIDSIKMLKKKIKLSDDQLTKLHERKKDLDMPEMFLSCKKLFLDVKSEFLKRIILYLSNDDNPVPKGPSRVVVFNEIKTFSAKEIIFQIIPSNPNFNYKLFYNELFNVLGTEMIEEICTDSEGLTQKLQSTIVMKKFQTKVLFYPFKGDTGRFMKCLKLSMIKNFNLVNTFMTRSGQKVVSMPKVDENVNADFTIKTNQPLEKQIKFDPTEVENLKNFSLPKGLHFLYFANRLMDVGHHMFKPHLIRSDPKEELQFFQKFWDYCVKENRVMVCIAKRRQPDKLRYVQLSPLLVNNEPMFLETMLPFGNEVMLPFKETYPEEEDVKQANSRRQAIEGLVDELTFDYDSNMFPDVQIEKKKAYIKAKLLEEQMEEVMDVEVNHDQLDEQLHDVVSNIKREFSLEIEKKRKAPSGRGRGKRGK